jgi:hypothetical protein
MLELDVAAATFLTPSAPPPGQLKPRAAGPGRLRPLKLRAVGANLRDAFYLAGAFHLLAELFPGALRAYPAVSPVPWTHVIAELYRLIDEAGWFEVSQTVEARLRHGYNEYPPPGRYLTNPPVQLYGWRREDIKEWPPLYLMWVLLDPSVSYLVRGVTGSGALLDEADLTPLIEPGLHAKLAFWTEADRLAAWARLKELEARPRSYPGPPRRERDKVLPPAKYGRTSYFAGERLGRLPGLARWACHMTGNLILDNVNEANFGFQDLWTWADLPEIRQCWRQARPAIDQLRPLMDWYEADADCLSDITSLLVAGSS